MATVYLYADETGNLDYNSADKPGESRFFGFGTATFPGDHGDRLFEGLELRTRLAAEGLGLPKGFHAKDDSVATRNAMFGLIAKQQPRFDLTFLEKPNAYQSVKDKGQMYLYQLAWYLHFKEIAKRISNSSDTLVVVCGVFGTKTRNTQAHLALSNVCAQVDRDIRLCVWQSCTSWGLQVADYGLWAAHRTLSGKRSDWYNTAIKPSVKTFFQPWQK